MEFDTRGYPMKEQRHSKTDIARKCPPAGHAQYCCNEIDRSATRSQRCVLKHLYTFKLQRILALGKIENLVLNIFRELLLLLLLLSVRRFPRCAFLEALRPCPQIIKHNSHSAANP